MNNETTGDRIKKARKAKSKTLTQAKLAMKINQVGDLLKKEVEKEQKQNELSKNDKKTIKILKDKEKLAEKFLALSQDDISRFETGSRTPSLEIVLVLARALDTTTDYLIAGDNLKQTNNYDDSSPLKTQIERLLSGCDDELLQE